MDAEKLVDYVMQFDRGFAQRIAGAAENELRDYEALVSKLTSNILPESYVQYLRRFGKNDGGLRPPRSAPSMDLDELKGYYEGISSYAHEVIPRNCVVVAYQGVGLFELSLEIKPDGKEPRVLFTSGAEIKGEASDSLEKLLFQGAFLQFRIVRQGQSKNYRPMDGRIDLAAVADGAERAGFAKESFSDRGVYCAQRGNVCLYLEQLLGERPLLIFSSVSTDDISHAVAAFSGPSALVRTNKDSAPTS